MGFLLGNSCFSLSSCWQSFVPPSNHVKNAKTKIPAMPCLLNQEHANDANFLRRRPLFLVGLSTFPFLQSRARAAEDLLTGTQDKEITEEGPKYLENLQQVSLLPHDQPEQVQEGTLGNPFLALLNGLGIIGLGVLGALYAMSQNKKTAMESTIELIKTKLGEKEATLASANMKITRLQQEVESEKQIMQDLKLQINQLQCSIEQAGKDKKVLEAKLIEKQEMIDVLQDRINLLSLEIKDKEKNINDLSVLLAEKESDYKNLTTMYEKAEANLAEANSEVKDLKEQLRETKEELEAERLLVGDLNVRIKLLLDERENSKNEIQELIEECNDLKSRVMSVSELLANKDKEICLLKEHLDLAHDEVSKSQVLVAELKKERNNLRTLLEIEANSMKNLRNELQVSQENLEASRRDAADLSRQLNKSKRSCEELRSELSRIQFEFANAKQLLTRSLDDANSSSKELSDELASVKELLKKTKEDLLVLSNELKAAIETRDSLKKELLDVYKKAESAADDLKEEKELVSSLNRELEASSKQLMEDKEARRTLERDLEEATRSLDEMNKNALMLSRELDITNSRTATLEAEKDLLYKSLTDQKDAAKESRENLEDVQDFLMRLSKEKEGFGKRAKRLEEELAAAKGEILRLRSQINLTRDPVSEDHQQNSSTTDGSTPVVVKRVGRRRKGGPRSEVPQ